jgi:Cys-tRNA(Pro) deacylase
MPVSTPATQSLDRLSVPYSIFQHTHPPGSLDQAARERGQEPGQVVRSILFRCGQDVFIMVLMAGPGQISWKRLRAHLGLSRLSMASESEVREVTGYQIGTVSPLGLQQPIRVLADVSVFKPEEVSLGCGVRGAAIIMKSSDLQRSLGKVEIGIFAV